MACDSEIYNNVTQSKYWHLANVGLCRTVSEISADIGRKPQVFLPLILTPLLRMLGSEF